MVTPQDATVIRNDLIQCTVEESNLWVSKLHGQRLDRQPAFTVQKTRLETRPEARALGSQGPPHRFPGLLDTIT